jgi:hypothetical protein
MKNKLSIEAAAPANAVQLSSTKRAKINLVLRRANRKLETDKLLAFGIRFRCAGFHAPRPFRQSERKMLGQGGLSVNGQ